ncbi:uncharacterized protein PolD3 [Diabrotica undecimpunctata]|uniref:uncharacterized protein PolD3 n=1 Tax=Diabrotica undecimpunctata TaxID=50387 RepID=UPI003B63BF2F
MMDSATEEIYFQRLQEYVQDDDKSVTLPALARDLKVSIQDAKYLLAKYVKDQRKLNPKQLAVTYVLTGVLHGKGNAVIIVKETDLEEKRSLFDNVESETLFSVQKCKEIDLNSLSLVYDVTKAAESPLLGSIVSKHCIKRTLKVKKLPPPPPSTIKGKSSFFLPKTSSSTSLKSEESSSSKDEPKQRQNNKEKEADKKSTTNTKPKGGLSAFFSKTSSSSSIKSENGIKKEYSTISSSQPSELEELMEVDFQESSEEFKVDSKKIKNESNVDIKEGRQEVVKDEGKNNIKKSDVKNKKNKNKREREKSQEKSVKKRKRIVERMDSESDDMFENDEEDIVEKSDEEPERASSPVAKKPLAPKNKIRKAVDKTYMDEEGYIVTKTEYVYESAPEDDEPAKTVKNEPLEKPKVEKKNSASSENEVSSPKGGKGKKGKKNNMQNQPTLMNFFKKK